MYERGRWHLVDQVIGSLRLSASRISSIYNEAIQWGDQSRSLG